MTDDEKIIRDLAVALANSAAVLRGASRYLGYKKGWRLRTIEMFTREQFRCEDASVAADAAANRAFLILESRSEARG